MPLDQGKPQLSCRKLGKGLRWSWYSGLRVRNFKREKKGFMIGSLCYLAMEAAAVGGNTKSMP